MKGSSLLLGWKCSDCGNVNADPDFKCDKCGQLTRPASTLPPLEDALRDLTDDAPIGGFRQSAKEFNHNLPPIAISVTGGTPQKATGGTPQKATKPPQVDEEDLLPMKPRWFANVDTEAVFKGIVGVGAFGLVFVALTTLFSSHRDTVQVQALHWERTRAVEVLREHHEEDWEDDIPAEAYSKRNCESRDHGSEDCNCRRDSNGRETCDSCTRYDNWCQYTIRAWDRTWEAHLEGWTHNEHWPTVDPRAIERAGSDATRVVIDATYAVRFEGPGGRSWRREYDLQQFQRFAVGDRFWVTWSYAGEFHLGSPYLPSE